MNTFAQRFLGALLILQAITQAQGYLNSAAINHPKSSTTQLLAWSLPSPGSTFKSTWYQDCPNPTARRIVYEDYDDFEPVEFSYSRFGGGSDWASATSFTSSSSSSSSTSSEPASEDTPRRGSRIVKVGRRALQGIRHTLRP